MMDMRRRLMMTMGGLPPKDTLENTSWADIAKVAKAGKAAEYWAVGDTKTITFTNAVLGSASIVAVIMDFNYDDLADGSGKAPITFGTVGLFNTTAVMNSTQTNVGGWDSCLMRTSTMSTVLTGLESAIGTGIIKPVSKRTSAGNRGSTIITDTDSVWLMSEYELFGTNSYSLAGEKPTDISRCYACFTDNASRIKKIGISANQYWLRSPSTASSASFVACRVSGTVYDSALSTDSYGVAIGFCV